MDFACKSMREKIYNKDIDTISNKWLTRKSRDILEIAITVTEFAKPIFLKKGFKKKDF